MSLFFLISCKCFTISCVISSMAPGINLRQILMFVIIARLNFDHSSLDICMHCFFKGIWSRKPARTYMLKLDTTNIVRTFFFLKKFVFNIKIYIYYEFLVLVSRKIWLLYQNLAEKNGYSAEKNSYSAEINGYLAEKNGYRWKKPVTFFHFTRLERENKTKTQFSKSINCFQKNEHAHCVYGIKYIINVLPDFHDKISLRKIKDHNMH